MMKTRLGLSAAWEQTAIVTAINSEKSGRCFIIRISVYRYGAKAFKIAIE
jgi:hypothetical protein